MANVQHYPKLSVPVQTKCRKNRSIINTGNIPWSHADFHTTGWYRIRLPAIAKIQLLLPMSPMLSCPRGSRAVPMLSHSLEQIDASAGTCYIFLSAQWSAECPVTSPGGGVHYLLKYRALSEVETETPQRKLRTFAETLLKSALALTVERSVRIHWKHSTNHLTNMIKKMSPTENDFDIPAKNCYRMVILGSTKVGKTAIVSRFLNGRFEEQYTPTIEDFHRKLYSIKGDVYQLDILDTSGNHPFPAMRRLSILTGN